MSKLKEGFVQVYTGNGKGKTTAALGLAVRAAGFGLKTYIAQFMKEFPYSEINSLKYLAKWITIEQFGGDEFVYKKKPPSKNEIRKIMSGLNAAKEKMLCGKYDIIILDEACVSIYFKLIRIDEILNFIKLKPSGVEIVITGRYCPQEIIDAADLVTEMKEIKHYYEKGILSRQGIES